MRMKKLLFSILALLMTVSSTAAKIYINDQTGWEQIALYAWYDGKNDVDLLGGWPGTMMISSEIVEGTEYKVLEIDVNKFPCNIIVNDNNNGAQLDLCEARVARNYYYVVTEEAVTEAPAPKCHLYVNNQTGWEATALYAWYNGKTNADLLGDWPGIQAMGTVEKDGVTYLDFQVDATVFPANFIFNNNGGGTQLGDLYLEAGDYYLVATDVLAEEDAVPEPVGTRTIYLDATWWMNQYPIFAAHVWNKGDEDAADYFFTLVEGNIYKADIRDDASAIIFYRKDPNATDVTVKVDAGTWNTAQTDIPEDKDMFVINSWNDPWGEWQVYTPKDVIVKVKKPAGWAGLSIWAWDSKDATWMAQFTAWPGVACSPIGNDWYQFTVKADAWFMFNDGQESTSVQTAAANAPTATCYTISAEKDAEKHHLLVDADCATAGTPSTETVYERDVRVGYYGTICLPFSSNNITGVTLYSIAGQTEDGNSLYLDSESELQAGVPYFFLANSTKLVVTATGESTFTPNANHWYPSGNGLVGYINDGHEEYIPQNLYHYMLKDNGLYQVNSIAIVRSNYAYVNWSDIPTTTAELAPGRQRRVIGAQHTTTGVDNIKQTITPTKILRDGQLLIIRDGQLFTITGQMVK